MLKIRIYLALLFALLGMVLGVFFMMRGAVLIPFGKKLLDARVGVVVALAEEVESAKSPAKKLKSIAESLNVEAKLMRREPFKKRRRPPKKVEYKGREVFVLHGKRTPITTVLHLKRGKKWMVVWFPVDIEEPRRRIVVGLLILSLFWCCWCMGTG